MSRRAASAKNRLPNRWRWLAVLLAIATLCPAGCIQRRILVRSEPEGALVTIDHQPIGHTPVAVPFTYYGTREIQVEMDGFQSQKVKHRLGAPWYQIPPLDLVTDNFWPRGIQDLRVVDFQLTPLEIVDESRLLDRAGQLRANSSRNTIPMPLAQDDSRGIIDTPPVRQAGSPVLPGRLE
jgi:hypothetical protein